MYAPRTRNNFFYPMSDLSWQMYPPPGLEFFMTDLTGPKSDVPPQDQKFFSKGRFELGHVLPPRIEFFFT